MAKGCLTCAVIEAVALQLINRGQKKRALSNE